MTGSALVGVVFAAAFGLVVLLAIRRPLLARLAAREAVRRRGQSLLVIGGLMIGSAAITSALVGADSLDESSTLNAYRAWGAIDLTVTAGDAFFPKDVATRLADTDFGGRIDGVSGGIETLASVADLDSKQGEPAILLVGFDAAAQQPFGEYVLTDGRRTTGADLAPGDVLLSAGLAEALRAQVGDDLRLTLERAGGARSARLRVAGIATAEGPGAYSLRSAVFAPLPSARRVLGTDRINVVRLSGAGDERGGLDSAALAVPALELALADIETGPPLAVQQVKAAELDRIQEDNSFIRAMLIALSALIVAAGAALVVNLIAMLAEERRPRLAVLRALGLRRRGLIVLSVLEGALYSILAALAGTAIGVVAGRVVADRFARAFAEFLPEAVDFDFVVSVRPATVAVSFAAGAMLTLGVVALTARRTSRLSIAAAVRDLPEPAAGPRKRSRLRTAALVLLALVGLAATAQPEAAGRLTGGVAVLVVAALFTRKWLAPRLHATLWGLALAVFSLGIVATIPADADAGEFFGPFTMAVLVSVFGLSIVASGNLSALETLAGALGRVFTRLRPTLRPPLAYLSRRPLRTGLTAGVFAVILAIVSLLSVLLAIFRPQAERDAAGYDVRVISTGASAIELPQDLRPAVVRSAAVSTLGYTGPFSSQNFSGQLIFIPLFEVDQTVFSDSPTYIVQRAEQFDDDEAMWRAVLSDPSLVVSNFGSPGTTMTLRGASGPVELEVAGSQAFGILDGIMASPAALEPFRNAPLGVTLLADLRPGTDAAGFAEAVENSLFADGVDAALTADLLERGYQANRTFFSVIDVMMRMGLVVGILSLGIVASRAAIERRHAIGVLRALGFRRRSLMTGLVIEALLTATIGVAVGSAVGIAMAALMARQQGVLSSFGIDGPILGTALGLVYTAVLLVTIVPAWRASRLPPAEAVRYVE